MPRMTNKIIPMAEIEARCSFLRSRQRILVATGGCFDLLHPGHVRALQAARELGDYLIVCLNSDSSVRQLKGPGRPIIPEQDRAEMLAALEAASMVVLFDGPSPEKVLGLIRPHVWVKSADYQAVVLPERAVIERHGGRVAILPYHGDYSTTGLIEALRERI